MADTYEKDLGQKSSLTTSDYIRVVGSDNVSYKQGMASVMGAMKVSRTETTNSDFDNLGFDATLGSAFYRGPNISTMTNKPSAETNVFPWALDVINVNGYVKQILHVYTANGSINVYERQQYYSSGSRPFASWEKMPTRAEMDAITPKYRDITATTSGTGAIGIPTDLLSKPIIDVFSTGGTAYLVFRRDTNYFMVRNATDMTAIANTSVTLRIWYI